VSVFATTWAYEQRIKNSGAKFVLVALADFADVNGFCFPGQHTLAVMTSLDERTIRKHLRWLEENNFIRRSRAHDDKGRRTSDDIYLQAPPERLRPTNGQAEKSPAGQNDKRKKTARAYRKNQPPEKSPAYPLEESDEPSELNHPEAQPSASPPVGGEAKSDHGDGMQYLSERCGHIPDPAAQAGALKRLLTHYTLEESRACLDALLMQGWREARVSWLTVEKEIGSWKTREEAKRNAGNERSEKRGGQDHAEVGGRPITREERIRADLLDVSERVSYTGSASPLDR
jgi:hypothetical protein